MIDFWWENVVLRKGGVGFEVRVGYEVVEGVG